VLTFVPLTELKRVEEALGDARKLAEDIIDTVREPLIVLDGAFRVVSASRSFYQRFHVTADETVGRPLYELGDRQWDIPALRELLETVLPRHWSFDGYVVEQDFPGIGRRKMLLSARRIVRKTEETELILLAIEMPAPGEQEST